MTNSHEIPSYCFEFDLRASRSKGLDCSICSSFILRMLLVDSLLAVGCFLLVILAGIITCTRYFVSNRSKFLVVCSVVTVGYFFFYICQFG
jgi:hypothetical protein